MHEHWTRVGHLLPAAAAECVQKVARRKDTIQLQGQGWIVDEQVSRARQGTRKAMTHFPCLLQSRKSPPWIGSRVRRATLAEACRAQGLLPMQTHADDWAHPVAMSNMLGNSMASNVLLRVMIPLIRMVKPDIAATDPWATGRMQHLLRYSALAE